MQSSLSGSYKYSCGFFKQLDFFLLFFSVGTELDGHQGTFALGPLSHFFSACIPERGRAERMGLCCCSVCEEERESSVQPFLGAFPPSRAIPRISILRAALSLERFCKPLVIFFVLFCSLSVHSIEK